MSDRPVTVFLSAAEASGDEHAARLIAALRRRLPDARFVGVAGERMAAEGCEVVADLTSRAAMGSGPLLRVPYYYRLLRRVRSAMRDIRPDVFIPVDSPAWNWHLAAAARKMGVLVTYYIAPQVWAWAPWRVKKLARLSDEVACILPFEEPYLSHRGIQATYVGHPLLETLPPPPEPMPAILDAWAHGTWRVALLPGSRPGEIRQHAKVLAAAAGMIRRRWNRAECVFAVRNEESAALLRSAMGELPKGAVISVGHTRQTLAGSHFALAVSGTVTLEVAHFGVPMIVVYRTSAVLRILHRLLGRWAVPTPHFSLVNILAGRRIVPEFMPWRGRIRPVLSMLLEVMEEPGYLLDVRRDLLAMIQSLRAGAPGQASDNAADLIVETLRRTGRVVSTA